MNTATVASQDLSSSTTTGTILVADKFDESGLQTLRALGHEVVCEPDLTPETLPAALAEHKPKVLVVRSTKVRADSLAATPRLALVVRAGAGTDNIDLTAASKHGIYICNCPGRNSVAVAELVEVRAQEALRVQSGRFREPDTFRQPLQRSRNTDLIDALCELS